MAKVKKTKKASSGSAGNNVDTFGKELNLERKANESDAQLTVRVLNAIEKLPDAGWDALSENIKAWSNEENKKAIEAEKATKTTKKTAVEKAKKEAKAKVQTVKKDTKGQIYRLGSKHQQVLEIVISSGKSGINIAGVITKADAGKVGIGANDVPARIKHMLAEMSSRSLIAADSAGKFTATVLAIDNTNQAKANQKTPAPAKKEAPAKKAAPAAKAKSAKSAKTKKAKK